MTMGKTVVTNEVNSGISRIKWGRIDNQEIFLFKITNAKGSTLSVSNYGAAAQSLVVKDTSGRNIDVLLGYHDLEDYKNDSFYMGTVVGRCANRIAGAEVKIGTKLFSLTATGAGYHHHGGRIGFNKKVWEIVGSGAGSLRMRYLSTDGEEGYPGNLEVLVTYSFDEENNWVVEYEASTDKTTIVNLTQHAYFNLEGNQSDSVNEHTLQIYAARFLPVNHLQLPNGEVAAVKGTPFDFTEMVPIGLNLYSQNEQLQLSNGYDHCWVLEETHTPKLKPAATVISPRTGIKLNVQTTEPAVHFYSGNFLNTSTSKRNTGYGTRSGFCLETQHFPDAPHHDHFPSIVLKPGELFRSKTVFQFSLMSKNLGLK